MVLVAVASPHSLPWHCSLGAKYSNLRRFHLLPRTQEPLLLRFSAYIPEDRHNLDPNHNRIYRGPMEKDPFRHSPRAPVVVGQ